MLCKGLDMGVTLRPLVTVVANEESFNAIVVYSDDIIIKTKNHYRVLPFNSILGKVFCC